MSTNNHTATMEKEVLITREFDAPRELVFKTWTDPKHLERWYAPQGCRIEISRWDFRPGGQFLHVIRNEAIHDCWCVGSFREIITPEKIVYEMNVADAAGNLAEPTEVGMNPDWPRQTVVTVTFEAIGNRTLITLHQTVSETLAKRTGAYPSWLNMLDNLAAELKKLGNIQ